LYNQPVRLLVVVALAADVLYGWRRGQTGWIRLADLASLGLRGVSRLAVSPGGDRIALVTGP
jgi:hypothetical protein